MRSHPTVHAGLSAVAGFRHDAESRHFERNLAAFIGARFRAEFTSSNLLGNVPMRVRLAVRGQVELDAAKHLATGQFRPILLPARRARNRPGANP